MPKFAIDPATLALVEVLADTARPLNDEDDFSERQCNAQNMFFERVKTLLPRDQFADLESFCNSATTDEMIDEALRLVCDLRPFDAERRDREAAVKVPKQKRAKSVATLFRARLETTNFLFEAFGTTEQEAAQALHDGLERHGEQHGIGRHWFNRPMYRDDIDIHPIPLRVALRDGEPIEHL